MTNFIFLSTIILQDVLGSQEICIIMIIMRSLRSVNLYFIFYPLKKNNLFCVLFKNGNVRLIASFKRQKPLGKYTYFYFKDFLTCEFSCS